MTHRVNVNFSEGAYETISRRAEEKGITLSQHLRDCISLYRWWVEEEARGNHILVEKPNGRIQEAILL